MSHIEVIVCVTVCLNELYSLLYVYNRYKSSTRGQVLEVGGRVRTHRKERVSGEGKRLIHNSKESTLIKGRAGVTEETF